jgi:putative membrane protein
MMREPEAVLSEADATRLAEAVRRAEAQTSGEIRVVVSTRPLVPHFTYALIWAAVVALALPWPLAFLLPLGVPDVLALQAGCFVLLGALLAFTPLGARAVPRAVQHAAARGAALDHFLGFGIHQTRGRTGVLIFVALPEHRVEVVADEAIHASVGHAAWTDICGRVLAGSREGRLVDGLEAGIAEAGRLLALHAPREGGDIDELPNHIVLL